MKPIALVLLVLAIAGGCGPGGQGPTTPAEPAPGARAEAKVKDPVCGMMVDPKASRNQAHKGTTYSFCSKECQDKFAAAPDTYAK